MPVNANLDRTLQTFIAANRTHGTVVADDNRDTGLSVLKSWKLSVLQKVGQSRIESGNFLGKIAKGICGQSSVDKFIKLNDNPDGAMNKLYAAFEEASKPTLGVSAGKASASAKRAFRQPADVTPAKVRHFRQVLQNSTERMTNERRGIIEGMRTGQFDTAFKETSQESAQKLLTFVQDDYHGAQSSVELDGSEKTFGDVYKKGAQFFKDTISGLEYKRENFDPNQRNATQKHQSIVETLHKVRTQYARYQDVVSSKLQVQTQPRFERSTESSVPEPIVTEWKSTVEDGKAFNPKKVGDGSHLRTAGEEHTSKMVRTDSTIQLQDGDSSIERTKFVQPTEIDLDEVISEMEVLVETAYSGDGYDVANTDFRSLKEYAEGIGSLTADDLGKEGVAAVRRMISSDAVTHIETTLEQAAKTQEEYSESFSAFTPEFKKACIGYDRATTDRQAAYDESTRMNRLARLLPDDRSREYANMAAEQIEVVSNAFMKAETALLEAKASAPKEQVAAREAFEKTEGQTKAAHEFETIRDELNAALEDADEIYF